MFTKKVERSSCPLWSDGILEGVKLIRYNHRKEPLWGKTHYQRHTLSEVNQRTLVLIETDIGLSSLPLFCSRLYSLCTTPWSSLDSHFYLRSLPEVFSTSRWSSAPRLENRRWRETTCEVKIWSVAKDKESSKQICSSSLR